MEALVGEYRRRRPEQTVLYRVVQENYRTFAALCEEEERPLPMFVRREFEKYLSCGQLSAGFAKVHCSACGYDRLVGFSCKGRSWCPSCLGRRMSDGAAFLVNHVIGDTRVRHWVLSLPPPLRYLLAYNSSLLSQVLGAFIDAIFQFLRWKAKDILGLRSVTLAHPGAVTVIQRCSSSLQLNVHFHSIVPDGVFVCDGGAVTFHELPPPTDEEVTDVAWETCRRTRDILKRLGLWQDEADQADSDPLASVEPGLAQAYQASIRGVLSMGPRRGQRVVRFFGEAARNQEDDSAIRQAGYGFNLHARRGVHAGDRAGLESLARYILRPPLAQDRLELRSDGRVALHMKRSWRDGTTGMVFEPTDFLSRLTALVPRPRTNTLRFHGVYAPHARLRKEVVPDPDEALARRRCQCSSDDPITRSLRLSWAELLAHVFQVDVFRCPRCASRMSRIAWITEKEVIQRILRAVGLPTDSPEPHPPRSSEDVFGQGTAA
jgi:hypothetical protein